MRNVPTRTRIGLLVLSHRTKNSTHRIIIFGKSVGSGPAVHIAAREPVAGLIVQSGFTSAFRVMTRVSIVPFDKFPQL